MLHPPLENQNTPFTFKLIDRELEIRPVGVCDSWGAARQEFKAVSPPLVRLNLAACYLLMKAKYLPRRKECPRLSMNPLCLRAIWNGGIHKYWLALIRSDLQRQLNAWKAKSAYHQLQWNALSVSIALFWVDRLLHWCHWKHVLPLESDKAPSKIRSYDSNEILDIFWEHFWNDSWRSLRQPPQVINGAPVTLIHHGISLLLPT